MKTKTKELTITAMLCTAAFIYKRKHTLSGAVVGLLCGWGCMVSVMLLWNYLITPLYMGCPRDTVARLLLPAFLPFNLIKGGLNAALTLLVYKPVVTALRLARLIDAPRPQQEARIYIGVILAVLPEDYLISTRPHPRC